MANPNQFLQQIPGIYENAYGPYAQRGGQEYNSFNDFLNKLLGMSGDYTSQLAGQVNNPQDVVNRIAQTYSASPQYTEQKKQALEAGNQAAAAGGYLGSPQAQSYAENTASTLTNEDVSNYINRALGLRQQGLAGQAGLLGEALGQKGQEIGYGLEGAGGLAEGLASGAISQANLAEREKKRKKSLLGGLLAFLGAGAGEAIGPKYGLSEESGGLLGAGFGGLGSLFL